MYVEVKKLRVVTGTAKYEVVPKVLEKECFAAGMWLVCGLFVCHTVSVAAQRLWKSLQTQFFCLTPCVFSVFNVHYESTIKVKSPDSTVPVK